MEPTREIPLSQGYVAIVDAADYDAVAAFKWSAMKNGKTVYAVRAVRKPDGRRTLLRLHTALTGLGRVDHRNGNGLDNRRANLRPVTAAQNGMNSGLSARNKSGYKGVYKGGSRWRAQIRLEGASRYLGRFDTPEEAARAYDKAAREHYGEFGRLNFPDA